MFINFIRAIFNIFFTLFYRVRIIGIENVPAKGSVLLCSNHIAELDMFFIGYKLKRLVRYMAKKELFNIPLLSIFFRKLGAFPVSRGKGDVGAIKTALNLLEEGHIVGIFPEGTRLKNRKDTNIKVKPGAALLAQKSGAAILPVAISGSYRPFSKIKIVFGKPFTLDLDKDKKYTNSELVEISEGIMKKVYSLLEE
ncbi:lysophospholipid acyltransferase family protein [Acetivibrio mesophilus]|uniref:1-acyl-sn-glycerol-3-phosphate acyltransferase n=1 Tax=Acetivibrio mesophilus TaxID=2487273 RepID=A0A4Q0I2A2_9FIRM|nr:lysophospholipid acyltransferase family protein [Acetivibrio mesophilus]ODM25443.1 acyl-phosphate glycerol 3-phosphate acyltransferase [Clostridium sp. Bc-iso-3]RXE58328.1 1-acyl-sn-glycerol-3-phosphate acyltransferase [Acetivibrio mesophilus]HHV28885.1 1-acyl-sn-glycerol-3-phosphate acyltransferase [Clostridium sp.]